VIPHQCALGDPSPKACGPTFFTNFLEFPDLCSPFIPPCPPQLSLLGMATIHVLHVMVPPPPNYPHIYPLLFSVYSAVNLGLLLLYMNARQLRLRLARG
jgi:hypothetical protein